MYTPPTPDKRRPWHRYFIKAACASGAALAIIGFGSLSVSAAADSGSGGVEFDVGSSDPIDSLDSPDEPTVLSVDDSTTQIEVAGNNVDTSVDVESDSNVEQTDADVEVSDAPDDLVDETVEVASADESTDQESATDSGADTSVDVESDSNVEQTDADAEVSDAPDDFVDETVEVASADESTDQESATDSGADTSVDVESDSNVEQTDADVEVSDADESTDQVVTTPTATTLDDPDGTVMVKPTTATVGATDAGPQATATGGVSVDLGDAVASFDANAGLALVNGTIVSNAELDAKFTQRVDLGDGWEGRLTAEGKVAVRCNGADCAITPSGMAALAVGDGNGNGVSINTNGEIKGNVGPVEGAYNPSTGAASVGVSIPLGDGGSSNNSTSPAPVTPVVPANPVDTLDDDVAVPVDTLDDDVAVPVDPLDDDVAVPVDTLDDVSAEVDDSQVVEVASAGDLTGVLPPADAAIDDDAVERNADADPDADLLAKSPECESKGRTYNDTSTIEKGGGVTNYYSRINLNLCDAEALSDGSAGGAVGTGACTYVLQNHPVGKWVCGGATVVGGGFKAQLDPVIRDSKCGVTIWVRQTVVARFGQAPDVYPTGYGIVPQLCPRKAAA
jgi:hypothetical protein